MAWPEPHPDLSADERTTLTQFLDHWRARTIAKLSALTDAEATARPLPATELSVAGIVSHLAFVEDRWFHHRLAGRPLPDPWTEHHLRDPAASMDPGGRSTTDVIALYDQACERSRAVTAALALDDLAPTPSFGVGPVSLRWVLVHLLDETACHAGHLDLLSDALLAAR
jgi:hypothetical protein